MISSAKSSGAAPTVSNASQGLTLVEPDRLLTIGSLTAGYAGTPILREFSLSIERGASLAVVGRNGVGKTTLAKAIVGLIPAMSGQILLGGRDITKHGAKDRAHAGIGYVPQGRGIFGRLTVFENLCMGETIGPRRDRYDYERMYDLFPILKRRRDQKAGTLSGGEQQMLAIARVLLGRPELLVLDEPSEGVQPSIVEEIAAVVARENVDNGLTVLLIEQKLDVVYMASEYCVVLEKGAIVAWHSPEELAQPELAKKYLAV